MNQSIADPSSTTPGVVYVIGAPDHPLVKIGTTTNLPQRFASISTMSPIPLQVLWSTPGGRDLETALHRRFENSRRHGEWFDFGGRDPISEISTAAAELAPAAPRGESSKSAGELIEELRDAANELSNALVEDAVRTGAELGDHLDQLRWIMLSLRIAMGMLKGSFENSAPTWPAGSDSAQQVNVHLDGVRMGLQSVSLELRDAFEILKGSGAASPLPRWCGKCNSGLCRQCREEAA